MRDDLSIAYMSAETLVQAFQRRELSPVEAYDSVRRVAQAREPFINALAAVDDVGSRRLALASEHRWLRSSPLSELDGVPVTIKENIPQAGLFIGNGSASNRPVIAAKDGVAVERVKAAGMVPVGSTVMPDWGMLSSGVSSLHGITRSPRNLAWTTGGSSSGAAAACAAGYAPINIGTDIGGSIRLPANWVGLAGLKPSHGRVPLDSPYLGRVAGPITRSVRDSALAMSVMSGADVRDYSSLPDQELAWTDLLWDPRGCRVGLLLDAGCGVAAESDVRDAVENLAKALLTAGAIVEPMTPFMDPHLLASLDRLWRVRSWADFCDLDTPNRDRVLPFVEAWCRAGSEVSGLELMNSYHAIMEIQRRTAAASASFDLVISPVARLPAFDAGWPMPYPELDTAMHHIGYTAPFSMSGQPAISVPSGQAEDGRPLGVQIAGERFADLNVLRAAYWWEEAGPVTQDHTRLTEELVPSSWASFVGSRSRHE